MSQSINLFLFEIKIAAFEQVKIEAPTNPSLLIAT